MQDPIYAVVVFAAMCISAAIGFFIHSRLSEKHRSPEFIALVQLMITLLVTFTAIVLGLLTTSVKAGFDAAYTARGDDAAQLAQLDRCLRDDGAETAPIREQLRGYAGAVIASTWPEEPRPEGIALFPDPAKMPRIGELPLLSDVLSEVGQGVNGLQPGISFHRTQLAACVEHYGDLLKRQVEGDRGRAPLLLAAILLGACDLAFHPVRIVRPDGASKRDGDDDDGYVRMSIAIAVFVILDMDEPYGGLFGVPAPRCATRSPI